MFWDSVQFCRTIRKSLQNDYDFFVLLSQGKSDEAYDLVDKNAIFLFDYGIDTSDKIIIEEALKNLDGRHVNESLYFSLESMYGHYHPTNNFLGFHYTEINMDRTAGILSTMGILIEWKC